MSARVFFAFFLEIYGGVLIFFGFYDRIYTKQERRGIVLYKNLSGYFREKYGKRLSKICIDGGFSCPNRDGVCGEGGCIFCGERGAGEHIAPTLSIRAQVEDVLSRAKDSDLFVAYFQNFTNTYADVKTLKERYDAALIDGRIRVLAIGTRPDCIDEEKAALIASYKDRCDVWVELGLQSASDETAERINRGYKTEVFDRAVKILEAHGIPVVAHIIIGLPGESLTDALKTAEYLTRYSIFGVKIHSIYVMRGTRLAELYERGEYTPPSLEEYVEATALVLSRLSPDLVIHRLTGDCPKGMLVAPDWNTDKHGIIEKIKEYMQENALYQGKYYKKPPR